MSRIAGEDRVSPINAMNRTKVQLLDDSESRTMRQHDQYFKQMNAAANVFIICSFKHRDGTAHSAAERLGIAIFPKIFLFRWIGNIIGGQSVQIAQHLIYINGNTLGL